MKSLIGLISFICVYNLSIGQDATPILNTYGQNLLINGDAEIDALNRVVYNWTGFPKSASSDYMQDSYGNIPGEWALNCDEKCGLPPKAGVNYFRFPVDDAYRDFSLTQTVNLSGYKDTLIVRNIDFILNAYIAGNTCTESGCARGILSVTFKDINGKDLESFEERKDNTEFTRVGDNDAMKKFEKITVFNLLPENAYTAEVSIKGKGDCCNPAFIFFDNVSFVLNKGEKREKKQ